MPVPARRRPPATPARALWWPALLFALLPQGQAARGQPPPEDDFGRWEQRLLHCRIQLQEPGRQETHSCASLRLDQQLAGLLSLRFLQDQRGAGTAAARLVLAGVLQPESRPMRCRDGACSPQLPLRLQVSAIARSGLNALELPQARVARGSCRLEGRRALCEASDSEGSRWRIEARW